ncbi:MAG: hypothetical protein HUJ90_00635, partial [Bacteroidales bacterium]|nr:hypothetical protein [Bacteroidales bacterium]
MLATAIAVAAQDKIPEQTTPAAPASPQEQVEQKSEEAGKSDGKSAFKKVLSIFSEVKIGGLGVAQYQASTQEGAKENSFILRYIRLSLEGRICKDFFFKIQGQLNGNTNNLGSSPRLLDAFLEWQRLPYLKIKIGQYKRPFTIENPLHPVDQGFMNYSQSTLKLAGMSDRIGEHASNGRDIGLQIQGDFLPDHSGRNLLHYQIGVFNGQGINTKDTDKKKDIIGGAWVAPVKGLRIGGFGWLGTYTRGNVTLDRKRYAISAEYDNYDWIVRSEYVHSYGYSFKTTYQNPSSATD